MKLFSFSGFTCFATSVAFLLMVVSCSSDDDGFVTTTEFEAPEFRTFEWTPSTGTPQEQIDRFVADNNLDVSIGEEGLIYVIYNEGEPEKPTVDSTVLAFYQGYKVDGQIFDRAAQTPRAFPLANVIDAWKVGIPLIGRGGRMLMIVRPQLAYKEDGNPSAGISGSDVLVFEVELVDFAG